MALPGASSPYQHLSHADRSFRTGGISKDEPIVISDTEEAETEGYTSGPSLTLSKMFADLSDDQGLSGLIRQIDEG